MRICLFEDQADRLDPLSLTRPIFYLVCGRTSLGWKQLRHWALRDFGILVRPHLEAITRLGKATMPVNDAAWLGAGPTVLVNGRWLPPEGRAKPPAGPSVGLCGDEVAFAVVGPEHVQNLTFELLPEFLDTWRNTLPALPVGGDMIRYPWDLVEHNGAQLRRDFAVMVREEQRPAPATPPALVGPMENLWIEPDAILDPYVVADTTQGPVIIDVHARVTAFSRLEGPCYVGPHTQVHGAKIRAGTTLGPQCRVGGEVEASIIHGNSNKYHEGFLGHSYVGEWVNLGAGTHNSDLRNDYGEVTLTIHGQAVASGQTKVGCFLGDHTKTGLGTLLNTGTSVGAFCNLLPAGRFAPKYMPSFMNWWNGSLREGFEMDRLMNTASQVMQRRGQTLTDAHIALYYCIRQETALERRRVMRESEQRALRRSA
jgi:UDP-N-acetylglucosamine diphosphorylase / glucose-1-phosphate thymidylyltransferase / UDP-N-acetylgalactosamine diphosphorylase / glucosamine-1-phosphate N-acetyltransferase / galactosamine-1-phosphate N-acetyltransferase